MKSLYLTALLTASCLIAGCNQPAATTANTAAPAANTAAAAPAAPAAPGGPTATATGTAQQNFTVVNSTQTAVLTLHVSSVNDSNWGPDILGSSIIAPGASAQVSFPRAEAQCNWDIKAVFTDQETSELRNINLCEVGTVNLTGN
jgi:hypothetical protein